MQNRPATGQQSDSFLHFSVRESILVDSIMCYISAFAREFGRRGNIPSFPLHLPRPKTLGRGNGLVERALVEKSAAT